MFLGKENAISITKPNKAREVPNPPTGILKAFLIPASPAGRRVVTLLVDTLIVLESFVVAMLLRFDAQVPAIFWDRFWPFAAFSAVVFIALLFRSGAYRNVLRYTGTYMGVRVAGAAAMAMGVLVVADLITKAIWIQNVPISVVVIGSVFAFVQLVAVRLYPRIFYERSLREVIGERKRALIVGTGEEGVTVARQLWRAPDAEIKLVDFAGMKPVGFVEETDGGEWLRDEQIEGIPVLGGVGDIERLTEEQGVDQILIVLPDASSEELDLIWRECSKTQAEVKVVPKLTEPSVKMASADLDDSDEKAVLEVVRSGRLALGPKVAEFERLTAEYTGAEHAVAVNSGTSGLHLLCRAVGLGPRDEVVTTPFSFVASTNCFVYEGATPVFVDVEPDTYNLDPASIEDAITPATKAILAVDVFGHPADWDAIEEVADRHGLEVIADSCESIGAEYRGRKTGPVGAGGAFAFYPNKQMTTGEGGIIVTNQDDVAALCRSMANQGRDEMSPWLEHARLGFNYRMDELSAALGVSQLRRIDEFVAKRAGVAGVYDALLEDEPRVRTPVVRPGVKMSFFVYVVELQGNFDRNAVMKRLAEKGVPSRAYFTPIHTQPYMRRAFGYSEGMFPVAERAAKKTIALPFYNGLSEVEAEYVVSTLVRTLDELSGERSWVAHG